MSIRTDKVASVLKRTAANPINRIASELSAGMATVTSVKISSDLQFAKIYISVFGGKITPAAFLRELDNRKGEIRKAIASEIRLRYTPDISFFIDDTLDQMEHIQKLLDSVKSNQIQQLNI